jgi:hypothetical protein
MSDANTPPADAPGQQSRLLTNGFIAVFLLCQLLLPLRYYLGADQSDERFSWRMFSVDHMQKSNELARAQIQVTETLEREGRQVERRLPIQSLLSQAWIVSLMRHRTPVVERLLEWRCEQTEAHKVRIDVTFIATDEGQMPPESWEMDCRTHRAGRVEAAR